MPSLAFPPHAVRGTRSVSREHEATAVPGEPLGGIAVNPIRPGPATSVDELWPDAGPPTGWGRVRHLVGSTQRVPRVVKMEEEDRMARSAILGASCLTRGGA